MQARRRAAGAERGDEIGGTPRPARRPDYAGTLAMQLPLMPGSEARYCVWRSGHEFCLPLEQVTEIIPFPQLTVVPRTPPFLLGIAEYGRTVLPVIYLADQNLVRAAEEAAPR